MSLKANSALLDKAKREIGLVEDYLRAGNSPVSIRGRNNIKGAVSLAADQLGESRVSFAHRVGKPETVGMYERMFGVKPDWDLYSAPAVEAAAAQIDLGGQEHSKIVELTDECNRLRAALKSRTGAR